MQQPLIPQDLNEYASFHEGACYDVYGPPPNGLASDYHWRLFAEYPIEKIDSPTELARWMREEIKMWAEEGQPKRYNDMFTSPIQEPVVLIEHEGKAYLWDGWHRCGASALRGLATVPAVVGKRLG